MTRAVVPRSAAPPQHAWRRVRMSCNVSMPVRAFHAGKWGTAQAREKKMRLLLSWRHCLPLAAVAGLLHLHPPKHSTKLRSPLEASLGPLEPWRSHCWPKFFSLSSLCSPLFNNLSSTSKNWFTASRIRRSFTSVRTCNTLPLFNVPNKARPSGAVLSHTGARPCCWKKSSTCARASTSFSASVFFFGGKSGLCHAKAPAKNHTGLGHGIQNRNIHVQKRHIDRDEACTPIHRMATTSTNTVTSPDFFDQYLMKDFLHTTTQGITKHKHKSVSDIQSLKYLPKKHRSLTSQPCEPPSKHLHHLKYIRDTSGAHSPPTSSPSHAAAKTRQIDSGTEPPEFTTGPPQQMHNCHSGTVTQNLCYILTCDNQHMTIPPTCRGAIMTSSGGTQASHSGASS